MSQQSSCLLTVLDLVPFGQTGQDSRFFALRLTRPDWDGWRPGQFVMVRPVSFGLEIPWARPFGICHMTARHLICFFQVQGKGTQRMAALCEGDKVRVWGPLPFLKTVRRFALEYGARCQLSLENRMACGVGACLGCVTRTTEAWPVSAKRGGLVQTCNHGPIFWANQIEL